MGDGRAAAARVAGWAAWAEADSCRLCLQGVLFVLHTGIRWEHLPQELGFGWGLPLKVITTGGNVPGIAMAESLIAAFPPVAGRIGRPRSKPPISSSAASWP